MALRDICRHADLRLVTSPLNGEFNVCRRHRHWRIALKARHPVIVSDEIEAFAPSIICASYGIRANNAARDCGDIAPRIAGIVDLTSPHFHRIRAYGQNLTIAERIVAIERVGLTLGRRYRQRVDGQRIDIGRAHRSIAVAEMEKAAHVANAIWLSNISVRIASNRCPVNDHGTVAGHHDDDMRNCRIVARHDDRRCARYGTCEF